MCREDVLINRIIVGGLVGTLWLCIVGAITLTCAGLAVPHEIYYLGTGSFGSLTTMVVAKRQEGGSKTTTGGSAEPPVVGK